MADLAVQLALSVLLGFLAMQDQLAQLVKTAIEGLQVTKASLENLASRVCQDRQGFLARLVFHCRPYPQYQAKTEPQAPQDPSATPASESPEQQVPPATLVQEEVKVRSGALVVQALLVLIVLALALLELQVQREAPATLVR